MMLLNSEQMHLPFDGFESVSGSFLVKNQNHHQHKVAPVPALDPFIASPVSFPHAVPSTQDQLLSSLKIPGAEPQALMPHSLRLI